MTYKMTLLNEKQIDINCPHCNNDNLRSQGPRKESYHMFQCNKYNKCHSRFLDTGRLVLGGKSRWQYGLEEHEK